MLLIGRPGTPPRPATIYRQHSTQSSQGVDVSAKQKIRSSEEAHRITAETGDWELEVSPAALVHAPFVRPLISSLSAAGRSAADSLPVST